MSTSEQLNILAAIATLLAFFGGALAWVLRQRHRRRMQRIPSREEALRSGFCFIRLVSFSEERHRATVSNFLERSGIESASLHPTQTIARLRLTLLPSHDEQFRWFEAGATIATAAAFAASIQPFPITRDEANTVVHEVGPIKDSFEQCVVRLAAAHVPSKTIDHVLNELSLIMMDPGRHQYSGDPDMALMTDLRPLAYEQDVVNKGGRAPWFAT